MDQSKRPALAVFCPDLPSVRAIIDATSRALDIIPLRDAQALLNAVKNGDRPLMAVVVDNAAAMEPGTELTTAPQTEPPRPDSLLKRMKQRASKLFGR